MYCLINDKSTIKHLTILLIRTIITQNRVDVIKVLSQPQSKYYKRASTYYLLYAIRCLLLSQLNAFIAVIVMLFPVSLCCLPSNCKCSLYLLKVIWKRVNECTKVHIAQEYSCILLFSKSWNVRLIKERARNHSHQIS